MASQQPSDKDAQLGVVVPAALTTLVLVCLGDEEGRQGAGR